MTAEKMAGTVACILRRTNRASSTQRMSVDRKTTERFLENYCKAEIVGPKAEHIEYAEIVRFAPDVVTRVVRGRMVPGSVPASPTAAVDIAMLLERHKLGRVRPRTYFAWQGEKNGALFFRFAVLGDPMDEAEVKLVPAGAERAQRAFEKMNTRKTLLSDILSRTSSVW